VDDFPYLHRAYFKKRYDLTYNKTFQQQLKQIEKEMSVEETKFVNSNKDYIS